MKVVYTGELGSRTTCAARLDALRKIEPEVVAVDYDRYFPDLSRPQRILEFRTFMGPRVRALNRDLIALSRQLNPDVIWIDKGSFIWPKTLRALKHRGAFLVGYNTDSLRHKSWSVRWLHWLLNRSLPEYDLYFTTNLHDHRRMRQCQKPRCELTFLGYDHERFNAEPLSEELQRKWGSQLIFVGHYEPSTEQRVLALVRAGLPVKVFGRDWHRTSYRRELTNHVEFRPLSDEDYEYAIKGAMIGLCFVSHGNGNQTAGRSFEIPGSGTFLLAERTPQHLECYVEGREAEFFGSPEELVHKAKYYLDRAGERRGIAINGHEKCRNNFSWARFMRMDWAKVLSLLEKNGSRPLNKTFESLTA